MTYFLGRDVKVAITTEHATGSFANTSGIASITNGVAPDGTNICDLNGLTEASTDVFTAAEVMKDVTAVDVTLGTVDEDIAYMGQNTSLKAEVKHETTITITKKRADGFFNSMFQLGFRYGAGGHSADSDAHDGLTQPSTSHGFRLFVAMKEASEVLTVPGCTFSEYSASLNADGVQEETITFVSHITPAVESGPDQANAIGSTKYPL
tara:strand:+ start:1985 stop:2608 length:624 start_codon:yes stop_codon:yes gene_type:complete